MIKADKTKLDHISQGDIFRDVDYLERAVEKEGIIEVSKIRFPLIVVLSQECDLRQDFKFRLIEDESKTKDKLLLSVLVAPLYNVEHVYNGEHLSELKIKMATINRKKTEGTDLVKNVKPRYHYLEFSPDSTIVSSVIDFKHYFSVNIEELKKTNFVCRIPALYREDISHRFASFLSRIGLPELADKPQSEKSEE